MLPVSKSFFAPEALASVVAERFRLPSVRCQLLNVSMRDVYRIDSDGGRYVFYVYHAGIRSREEIEAEWQIVANLARNGVSVVKGIPLDATCYTVPLDAPEGTRYGTLAPYIPGQHLRLRPDLIATEAYGRHIATIHTLTEYAEGVPSRPTIEPVAIVEWAVKVVADVLCDQLEARELVQKSAQELYPLLDAWLNNTSASCLLHGDVIRANALVGDDGAVTILDFDLCGYGPPAYDIASFLFAIRGAANEAASASAFRRGYESVRSLTPEEECGLKLCEAVRALLAIGIPAAQVNHWGGNYLESHLKVSLTALQEIMERLAG